MGPQKNPSSNKNSSPNIRDHCKNRNPLNPPTNHLLQVLITIISQCQKKALPRTRLVLDTFAERIGSNAWQTIITEEGLDALHTNLRQTASKSTAVACHWHRSRTRSTLLWIVGRKHAFNSEGLVPVNETNSEINQFMDAEKWKYLRLMKVAVSLAGLFHDFGKANDLFQEKLQTKHKGKNSEPLRHEWISCLIFDHFINKASSDKEWLDALESIESETTRLSQDSLAEIDFFSPPNLTTYPPLAQLVSWLIVSHHRIPVAPDKSEFEMEYIDQWLSSNFSPSWNSPQVLTDTDQERRQQVQKFSAELPHKSKKWRRHAMEQAEQALTILHQTPSLKDLLEQRYTAHLTRLALMLGDHSYSRGSSNDADQDASYAPLANLSNFRQPKQKLDEHNIGVAKAAREIVTALPGLSASLPELELSKDSLLSKKLDKKDPLFKKFGWQNDTIKVAKKIKTHAPKEGFFGVNMASTGKGKTIANAKILHALGSTRFNVALGLRTLTLQTGTSFRDDLELDDSQLATLIGGTAIKELYDLSIDEQQTEDSHESVGSDSSHELTDVTIAPNNVSVIKHNLSKWTKEDERIEKLLNAPVLVSTIDHLIPATEGLRGGKQIGPMLRLLTSDLILDEPDDFGLEDLPALSRLVNWSGMLGGRVLLSSATMPPALINALFRSYKQGREDYLRAHTATPSDAPPIACAWFDEFGSTYTSIEDEKSYAKQHNDFVTSRINALQKLPTLKRGALLPIESSSSDEPELILNELATTLKGGISRLHDNHALEKDGISLSIGLVRMANIDPLVAVAQRLMSMPNEENTHIHYCVYHSRFPLAVRSYLESKLDSVLKRNDEEAIWSHPDIVSKFAAFPDCTRHIFVVLASPVAEVGRDHDYDWAIAEPSSMRSIIQLAGRVLRHRSNKEHSIEQPNVLILQHNYKGLKGKTPCFTKPGFESSTLRMPSSDLTQILAPASYEVINSVERIRPGGKITEPQSLSDLEHKATKDVLISKTSIANKWWETQPTWCGNLQLVERFRASKEGDRYCLLMQHEGDSPSWFQINPKAINKEKIYVESTDISSLPVDAVPSDACWFHLSPQYIMKTLYQRLSSSSLTYETMTKRYGELTLINYNDDAPNWQYHPQLGIFKEI